jgi:PST family polysaccharide transporter
VVLDFFYNLLVAVGRSKVLFAIQAVWVASLVVALVIGADRSGIRGVGIGHVLVAGCIITPLFVMAVRPEGITARALAVAVARPLAGALLAAAAGIVVLHVVGTGLAGLATSGSTIAVVYAVAGVSIAELTSLPRIVFGRSTVIETPDVDGAAVEVAAS